MTLHRRARGVEIIQCVLQIALALGLYSIWMALMMQNLVIGKAMMGFTNYALYGFLTVFGLILHCAFSKGVNLLEIKPLENLHRTALQCLAVFGLIIFSVVSSKDQSISRLFLFSFIPALAVVLFLSNLGLPMLFARAVFGRKCDQRGVILVGTVEKAMALRGWLKKQTLLGVNVVGLITDEDPEQAESEFAILGGTANLLEQIHAGQATQVILLEAPASFAEMHRLMELCEEGGALLLVLSDWQEKFGRKMTINHDAGMQLLSFQTEPLQCPWNRLQKRVFDLMIALPVVIFIVPVASAIVWLIHRWQSPGPLFFRQYRVGAHGERFLICKYRTMHVVNDDETRQASRGDDRIFPLGHWLRKMSIDELPQFLNVLESSMSVVGPRPHLFEHAEEFSKHARSYRVRNMVKPGITGLAQVRGFRGETKTSGDVTGRVNFDLHYLENWSLLLDSSIVFRTMGQMFFPPKSAY